MLRVEGIRYLNLMDSAVINRENNVSGYIRTADRVVEVDTT